MNSRKKIKPGEIRITPEDNRLMEMPPYLNTQVSMPSWFRRTKKGQGSIRSCAGVNDYLTTGITVPLWTNVYFRPNFEANMWESRIDQMSPPLRHISIDGFPFGSTEECPVSRNRTLDTMQYPKVTTPWRVETAPGWSCLVLPVHWEPNPDYDVLPAVVHTDYYHVINIVLNIKTNTDFSIKYGTPMLHIVPFKRSDDVSKITFQDESYFKYVESRGFGFGNIIPSIGAAAPYRRNKIKIDTGLEKKKWYQK